MQISVRLDKDIGNKLERLAKDTKRTKSFYVQEAIKRFLEDMNDYMYAVEELKKIENDPNPEFYALDEVAKDLGINL
ncbi:TraY domain-containing protein [Campylobacter pinnipediorum]|uniref:type II toxin-antitoxin system RelB family antitoxin n=1 Tax=Campylobacter pinnipediorum TaxID=1965231 RepID=UPI000995D281|nr:ribbon-helix-helix domain-containing protein [Campylobacter pinnipediorum]AQW83576.1 toxin-antitoxin system, antitoxin component [Campylobacter pinnipediorum subsp. pinnipediorum]AQW85098.1 toxin-antitoxin system, antitoxin component [Campylobacter pinnipediorum subsp. pinnipediorum]